MTKKCFDIKTRFWRFILRAPEIKMVVKVKSLIPSWDDIYHCLAWPTLLVERLGGARVTSTYLWTKERYMFWRHPAE